MTAYRRTALAAALTVVALLGASTTESEAASITITPDIATSAVGDTIALNVDVTDVDDLYAYQFDLSFDPTVLQAVGISAGPIVSGGAGFIPGTIDNVAGSILFTADSLFGPVSGFTGSGRLATVTFQALALGTSLVSVLNPILLDSNLADIAIDGTSPSMVTVAGDATVPEPATLMLLGTGLMLGLRRMRKRE